MSDQKSIYELGLHESTTVAKNTYVLRVPGGWIYQIIELEHDMLDHVFIPYSDEFKPPSPKPKLIPMTEEHRMA